MLYNCASMIRGVLLVGSCDWPAVIAITDLYSLLSIVNVNLLFSFSKKREIYVICTGNINLLYSFLKRRVTLTMPSGHLG